MPTVCSSAARTSSERFTFVLDLGFGTDGTLYVLQAVPSDPDLDAEDPGPGVIVQVTADGRRVQLGGGGLAFPLGLAVTDDACT